MVPQASDSHANADADEGADDGSGTMSAARILASEAGQGAAVRPGAMPGTRQAARHRGVRVSEAAQLGLSVLCLCLGAAVYSPLQPLTAALYLLFAAMFAGFASLLASQNDVDVLLDALGRSVRARSLAAIHYPRWPRARAIYEALANWSAAQDEEVAQLRHRAQRDGMTMFPNRWYFKRLAEARIARTPATDCPGTMFFLDVDGFKTINDSLGHEAGDQTLVLVARRIALAVEAGEAAPQDVLVGRIGGDEFTIFAPSITTTADAMRLGERLQRVLSEPIEIDAGTAIASCSIGIAVAHPGDQFAALLSSADIAMYGAKIAGKNQIVLFSPEMAHESRVNKLIESDIRSTLTDGSLSIAYQPQFDCATRRIVSAEALLRWNHPVLGEIKPGRFVPIAERLGLISLFGDWVLEEAVKCIARLNEQGTPLAIGVNVSPIQLRSDSFCRTVKAILRRHKVPAHLLELEITESVATADCCETDRTLADLREAGVSIAIDDFGMGYSNLARLVRLPIDRVKIDKSMIDHVADHLPTQILVKTVVDMSNALGVKVLAEGIETEDQLALLVSLGCEFGQGFLISRPIPADTLAASLRFDRGYLPEPLHYAARA